MALGEELKPATDMFSGGFASIASYAWVLIPLVIIVAGFLIVWIWKTIKKKDSQWTHTLKVRRVLDNNRLSDPIIHRMRRFPLIKKAEVFELEKPLLGGYLLPELDKYSGMNEFSIILDQNNRIYTNKGEFFCPDKNSVNVSAKHSEIDIQRQNLKSNFQNINKINKRVEWATIAKYAFLATALIVFLVISIVAIQKWGESKPFEAQKAQAEARAMDKLNDALELVESNTNANLLLAEKIKEIYGTNNIQSELKKLQNG
jgi:hypothetical protein